MGKIKTEPEDENENETELIKQELTYEEKVNLTCIIAKPMASKKLAKKIYKLIKKAAKQKGYCRNGLKEVQMRLRKGETGVVVFAGDVSPIDIMCHLPIVCEEKNIPYCFTPSRADIGAALGVKRGTLMVLIREHDDYKELYDEVKQEVTHLAVTL
ncbi:H/ACA ribonucleoprotein complex subunit 2-like protein [Rhyzopertha dominica]|nr:H/ACA ribonucleoprotein complex subunit 2-like protein [Rhyzopertha dominica]